MIRDYAVLMTCYNRKDITLRCLSSLFAQQTSSNMTVFLCDDASTDGTYEVIKEHYPQVHLFRSSGNLFWNRGMLYAWKKACSFNKFDAYVWLNDDVILKDNALQIMLDASTEEADEAIICGCFCNSLGQFTYGGADKYYNKVLPNGRLQKIVFLNGNCVLVPSCVVDKIGLLDGYYHHHTGDFDYGLRAIEAGVNIVTTPCYIGVCEANTMKNRAKDTELSLFRRLRRLYSPLGANPLQAWHYRYKHFGLLAALKEFLMLHYINIEPRWLYKIRKTK